MKSDRLWSEAANNVDTIAVQAHTLGILINMSFFVPQKFTEACSKEPRCAGDNNMITLSSSLTFTGVKVKIECKITVTLADGE